VVVVVGLGLGWVGGGRRSSEKAVEGGGWR